MDKSAPYHSISLYFSFSLLYRFEHSRAKGLDLRRCGHILTALTKVEIIVDISLERRQEDLTSSSRWTYLCSKRDNNHITQKETKIISEMDKSVLQARGLVISSLYVSFKSFIPKFQLQNIVYFTLLIIYH